MTCVFYRDPEFLFYDGAEYKMSAFNVKPAVFDLFLAVAIGGYLAAMYFIVQVWFMLSEKKSANISVFLAGSFITDKS